MRYSARLCLAGALLYIAMGCSQHKNTEGQCICTIGPDTLTQHRIRHLVPDSSSMPARDRCMRAIFEVMYAFCAGSPEGAQDRQALRQIGIDLSQQLSRQTGDTWTPEAALTLYNAAKFLKSNAAEPRSVPKALAISESLFTKFVAFCDTASKREIILCKDSLFRAWSARRTPGTAEELLSLLLLVEAPISRLVCEFLSAAETGPPRGSDVQTMIKGLLYDSSSHRKAQTRPPATVKKDNSRSALMFRSQQSIKDSIARHIPSLEALYKKHLKLHQTMAGTVWVTFQISTAGAVRSAQLKTSSITEKEFLVPFQNYLIEKVRFKPVPEDVGNMSCTFPFEFSPEN